jgi:hypothetical protein
MVFRTPPFFCFFAGFKTPLQHNRYLTLEGDKTALLYPVGETPFFSGRDCE